MSWETLEWVLAVVVGTVAVLGYVGWWLYRAEKRAVDREWSRATEDPTTLGSATLEVKELWEEYSYRHSHIWRVVFQATAAVVGLSIVPYLDTAAVAGRLRFIVPLVAAALALFATTRIQRELWLLKTVKDEYLRRTRIPARNAKESSFARDTLAYLTVLFVGSLFHALAVIFVLGSPDSVSSTNPCCIP